MEEDSILLFNLKKNNGTNIYQNILIAIMPCKFDVVWQIKAPIIWLQSYQKFFSNCRMWITTWSSKWGYTRLRHYRLLRGKELNQTWSIQFFGEGIFTSALRHTEKDIYWSNHRRLATRNFITWLLHIISKQGLCFHSSFFNSKCYQIFTAKCLKHFFLFYEKT